MGRSGSHSHTHTHTHTHTCTTTHARTHTRTQKVDETGPRAGSWYRIETPDGARGGRPRLIRREQRTAGTTRWRAGGRPRLIRRAERETAPYKALLGACASLKPETDQSVSGQARTSQVDYDIPTGEHLCPPVSYFD